MGYAYGEVVIESGEGGEGDGSPGACKDRLVISFKNENIYAKKVGTDGKEEVSSASLSCR